MLVLMKLILVQVKAKPWEQSLVSDSLSGDIKELLRKAEECEMEYLQILPKPGASTYMYHRTGLQFKPVLQ